MSIFFNSLLGNCHPYPVFLSLTTSTLINPVCLQVCFSPIFVSISEICKFLFFLLLLREYWAIYLNKITTFRFSPVWCSWVLWATGIQPHRSVPQSMARKSSRVFTVMAAKTQRFPLFPRHPFHHIIQELALLRPLVSPGWYHGKKYPQNQFFL